MKATSWFLFVFLCTAIGLYPIVYFVVEPTFGLLSTKPGELLGRWQYNMVFYAHIVSGGVALLVGWPQFSERLRQRYLTAHRMLGKIYVVSALTAASSGFALAFFATGGWVSALGFGMLSVIYFASTWAAWQHIRALRVTAHQKWMIFSFAACFAAVTLRIWLPLLTMAFDGMFVPAYRTVAWLCWAPNIAFAAWWTRGMNQGQ